MLKEEGKIGEPEASPERPSASAEAIRCRAGLATRPPRLKAKPMAGGGVAADTCLARPSHSAWQEGGR